MHRANMGATELPNNWPEMRKTLGKPGFLSTSFKKLTERTGFEPAVGNEPYAELAIRCFRPLSHLSSRADIFPESELSRKVGSSLSWTKYRKSLPNPFIPIAGCCQRLDFCPVHLQLGLEGATFGRGRRAILANPAATTVSR